MKNLKDALSSITETREDYRGSPRVRYVCELGSYLGKRQRIVRGSRPDCEAAVRDYYAATAKAKENALSLTSAQVADCREAIRLRDEAHDTHLISYIVRDWLEHNCVPAHRSALAFREYIAKYSDAQTVQRSLVIRYVGGFAEQIRSQPHPSCAEIFAKPSDLAEWLAAHYDNPATYNTALGYIQSFARWCAKPCRAYISAKQCEAVCSLERLAVAEKTIGIVTPDELARIVDTLHSPLYAYHDGFKLRFTLAFLCGMRSAEIDRCERSWFQKDGTIFVEKAKGWQSRAASRSFMPCEAALEWLRCINVDDVFDHDAIPSASEFDKFITRAEKDGGFTVPKNAARHSFITYHSALYGDRSKTLTMTGTSDQMARIHYRRNATVEDARWYFSVMPRPKMQRLQEVSK